MAFEVYFSIEEIALRLDKAARTVRRWVTAGEFRGVVNVPGGLMVPESGVEEFLAKRRVDLSAAALSIRQEAMRRRLGRIEPGAERMPAAGICARSPGELVRKLDRTSGRRAKA